MGMVQTRERFRNGNGSDMGKTQIENGSEMEKWKKFRNGKGSEIGKAQNGNGSEMEKVQK